MEGRNQHGAGLRYSDRRVNGKGLKPGSFLYSHSAHSDRTGTPGPTLSKVIDTDKCHRTELNRANNDLAGLPVSGLDLGAFSEP